MVNDSSSIMIYEGRGSKQMAQGNSQTKFTKIHSIKIHSMTSMPESVWMSDFLVQQQHLIAHIQFATKKSWTNLLK